MAIHPQKAQNCGMRSHSAIVLSALVLTLAPPPSAAPSSTQKPAELVDINRATIHELESLPGMTETWASRIVRFRPYRTKLDLLDQGVVSPEVYQRIRDRVIAHHAAATKAVEPGK